MRSPAAGTERNRRARPRPPPRPVTDRHRCCVTPNTCLGRRKVRMPPALLSSDRFPGVRGDLLRRELQRPSPAGRPGRWRVGYPSQRLEGARAAALAVRGVGRDHDRSAADPVHWAWQVSSVRTPSAGSWRWPAASMGRSRWSPTCPSAGAPRNRGGDRIGPSIERSGSLRNDSLKANGGGGIGVAAPAQAQSIACPPLSRWPWVSRVHFAHAALQLARASKIAPGRLQLHLTCGDGPVF